MRLIQRIEIKNFRSIRHGIFKDLGDVTALVGSNSSGKSNVLRALNLFFNNEVEAGQPLQFNRDYYEQVPRARRRKRISVKIDFQLPSNLRFRRELNQIEALGKLFSIERSWQLDPRREPTDTFRIQADGKQVRDDPDLARHFLALIAFRYVPNRSIPAKILKDESQAIANSLFARMKGDKHSAALLSQINATASRLLQNASLSLERARAPLSSPSMATADSIGEMLTMKGFQADGAHGGVVQDEEWGSGHQAFFLYQVLHALDTDYGRFFGWRQAVVWGLEEPESALHRDLETSLAGQLRTWAQEDKRKLQVLYTTHSPIFSMAADSGFFMSVDKEKGSSRIEAHTIADLTRRAEDSGVSAWTHPILSYPWNPTILVEGVTDARALRHVSLIAGLHDLRFVSLRMLDGREGGDGKDSITSYLRRNKELIANRPHDAPLIVLLDWDVSDQEVKRARQAYGEGGADCVIRMDPSYCHKLMGEDFRGIERFYPPRLIRESSSADEMNVAMKVGQPYSVSRKQLGKGKVRLNERLTRVTDVGELRPLIKVLKQVADLLMRDSPVQFSMPGV